MWFSCYHCHDNYFSYNLLSIYHYECLSNSAKTTPEVVEDMFINNTRYLKNGNFIKPDNYGFKNIKKAR